MRTIIIMFVLTCAVTAQTIYKVTPGTTGNKIILTVENSSDQEEMTCTEVALVKQLSTISLKQAKQEIETIEKNSSKEVEFAFDVNRIVDVNKTDTLKFLISNKTGSWTKEILIGYELPKEFKLEQNYPNPFNPETRICYQVPETKQISLKVYDILGREVMTLVDGKQEAGYYEIKFNGKNLSSGIYIYRLIGENVNLVKKMMFLK
jgi:hypothetical protein